MTAMEKEEIEQLIVKAIQAGKAETSGLVDAMLKKMDNNIGEAVEKHVNGKIRKLTEQVTEHNFTVDQYIKDDISWKERNEPFLQALANISGAGKLVVVIALGISAILGACLAIKNIFK